MADFRALLVLVLTLQVSFRVLGKVTSGNVGVCYGLNGNNLPSPKDVVKLYERYNIRKMRIYEPYPQVLEALRGSTIDLTLGVRNNDIPTLALSEGAANSWFMANVHPYVNHVNIRYISVGNEVIPGAFSGSILPAMQHLQNVLRSHNLRIKATTVVHSAVLGSSYPPSTGTFSDVSKPFLSGITKFLSSHRTPLLVNLYPYFPYAADPNHVSLAYAHFSAREPVVRDGKLSYFNLLDAMLDAFYSAMERVGVKDVDMVISESGWPHDGNGNFTTPGLAAIYNRNFISHVNHFRGTPKRPRATLQGFIFAMFDEDLKDPGVEQHWGLFSPSMHPNYKLFD